MKQEILEIKALIDRLRAADTQLRVFGSQEHRYRIGPKLSEAEIERFEQKHGIVLPEDYRLYLQLVGNGNGEPRRHKHASMASVSGAGPSYGLYPLAETVYGDRVTQPFPFEEKVELPDEPPYDDWYNGVPGALEISTMGCCSHVHLIVVGPTRGTIWEGFGHDHFDPTHQSFSQWMRAWAEKFLSVFASPPLAQQVRVGMTKAEVFAATGEDWFERELEGEFKGITSLMHGSNLVQLMLDEQKIVVRIDTRY